ncbi:DUF2946 domain-containing protein [Marinobacter sp. 1Y8]
MSPRPGNRPSSLGFDRRQRQRSAWLALLSMALIFAGPVVSNVQALTAAPSHIAAVTQPAKDHHAGGHHKPAANTGHSGHHEHSDGADQGQLLHASCGYCILLFHTASLSLEALPITAPERWAPSYQNLPIQSRYYTLAAYSVPQSRAPPHVTV